MSLRNLPHAPDKYYTHIGEQAQQQAIAAISNHNSEKKSAQKKIDAAIALVKNHSGITPELREQLLTILS